MNILKTKIKSFKRYINKSKIYFFNIRKDSIHPNIDGKNNNPIVLSHLFNRIAAILSILIALVVIFKNLKSIKYYKLEIYFLEFFSNIFPHILGGLHQNIL